MGKADGIIDNGTIGSRIQSLRKEKKISQSVLAEEIGTQQSVISSYENNDRKPDAEILNKLVCSLGTTYQYLLEGIDSEDILSVLTKYIQLKIKKENSDDAALEYLTLEINSALLGYLFQVAKADSIPKLPPKAKTAWFESARTEFQTKNLSSDKKEFHLIPCDVLSKINILRDVDDLMSKSMDYFEAEFLADESN